MWPCLSNYPKKSTMKWIHIICAPYLYKDILKLLFTDNIYSIYFTMSFFLKSHTGLKWHDFEANYSFYRENKQTISYNKLRVIWFRLYCIFDYFSRLHISRCRNVPYNFTTYLLIKKKIWRCLKRWEWQDCTKAATLLKPYHLIVVHKQKWPYLLYIVIV